MLRRKGWVTVEEIMYLLGLQSQKVTTKRLLLELLDELGVECCKLPENYGEILPPKAKKLGELIAYYSLTDIEKYVRLLLCLNDDRIGLNYDE